MMHLLKAVESRSPSTGLTNCTLVIDVTSVELQWVWRNMGVDGAGGICDGHIGALEGLQIRRL